MFASDWSVRKANKPPSETNHVHLTKISWPGIACYFIFHFVPSEFPILDHDTEWPRQADHIHSFGLQRFVHGGSWAESTRQHQGDVAGGTWGGIWSNQTRGHLVEGKLPCFPPDKNAYQGIGALLMWCQEVRVRMEVIIPARDPKQCVVRIRKGKVERIQNQQWFQASRIRVTLVVKEWCSFKVVSGRRDTRLNSASSLCEDFCKKSWTSSPWQVLCRSCCARSFCKANCTRSLQEISTKDRKRSLSKTSVQALYRRSLSKISVLFTRSLYKISKRIIRDLLRSPGKIFVYKISIRALLARSL